MGTTIRVLKPGNGAAPCPSLYSEEAEKGVLGSMMIAPQEAIPKCIKRGITEDHFFVPAHKICYRVLVEQWNAGKAIDDITFTQTLRDQNVLETVGGAAAVTHWGNFVPTAANLTYYLDIVCEKKKEREAFKIFQRWQKGEDQLPETIARLTGLNAPRSAAPRSLVGVAAPINLSSLLDKLIEFFRRYIYFRHAEQSIAIALWVVHAWLIDAFEFTPYLHVVSPEKRCGKTLVLECLSLLVREPWKAVSPSEAVLYRKIEASRPTLLLDEVDTIFSSGKDDRKEHVRALLNAGFERKNKVPRCVPAGRDFVIKEFDVFCAKAIAGIGPVPDTVADRCIKIPLVRRSRDEVVQRFRRSEAEAVAAEYRAELEQYADEPTLERLGAARPPLPEELSDRHADICEPLLAIADEAGGDWPTRSRAALVALCALEGSEDDSLGVKLLQSVRDIFDESDTDRFSTRSLLEKLVAQETDAPWAGWWETDLDHGNTRGPASKLARMLKPYGIRVRSIRLPDGSTPKGYHRDDFEPVWKRYCPLPPKKDATTPQDA